MKLLTGNDLSTGDVVWWTGRDWSRHIEDAVDVGSGGGFVLLLLVAALGGALLNFTPCVLPVIPLKIMGLSSAAIASKS